MSYEKSTFEYTKRRRDFGRQPLFQDVPAHMLDSINPDKTEQKLYMLRNPVHRQVQATLPQSQNETNTKTLVTHEQGINHTEGGWPREVHLENEDHLNRHRRRVMHEDNYVNTVLNLTPVMEHYVNQNNAIDMYQTYFAGMTPQEPVETYTIQIENVFRDQFQRPISSIAWTNEKSSKLAVSYYRKLSELPACHIWDTSIQTAPVHELKPEIPCWQLACSPVDPEVLIAGLENGIVNVFDIRESAQAVSSSSVYNSHRGPISAMLYTHSRTNTEFFTGSPDGQCIWWDTRNLMKPLDRLPMSIIIPAGEEPNLSNAEGVSSLEFDHGLPTRFLCGTESGLVINANRMGRTHSEILTSFWNSHSGPVKAVHRSPCTLRMFLTCGDFTVRVWSEEIRTAPIIVTKPYRHEVTDTAWAPLRFSSYMVVSADGFFYYWDFLRKYKEPVATLRVSKHELTKLKPHANGQSVAVGDNYGCLFLLQLSENMTNPESRNKQLMFQLYERETRREHILDTRIKEIRLKMKAEEEEEIKTPSEEISEDDLITQAEMEYYKIVKNELHQMDILSTTPSSITGI